MILSAERKRGNTGTKLRAVLFSVLMLTSVFATSGTGGVVAAASNGSETVTCGVIIDEPGTYYIGEDLTGLSSTCITITASDVTFDGNGYLIGGDSPDSNTYGIFADGTGGEITNVVVRNVDVVGWDGSGGQGVRFENIGGGEISNVNANDNDLSGIELYDTSDVTVSNAYASGNSRGLGFNFAEQSYVSVGNVIEDSTFESNTVGVRAQGIEDTVIRDTDLDDNNNRGFWKDGGVNTTIERTSASNNDNEGFRISSGDVTITDSEATNNNGEAGVWLDTTSNALIENVTANDNNQAGIFASDNSATGQHTLLDNTVRNNGFAGIWIDFSAGTTVSGTTATGNEFGIKFWDTNDNTISNTYATDNVVGIDLEGSSSGVTTFSNNVLVDNTDWDFKEDGGHDYTVESLDLGASTAANTTVSFVGDNVRIRGVSNPPAHAETGIDRYFEAEGTELDVDVHYLQSDVETVIDDWLTLWKHDGSEWIQVDGSTVDTVEQTVSASITDFSTFGVFESQPPAVFEISIDETNAPVTAGEELRVTTTVTNTGSEAGTQTVELLNGTVVIDSNESVELSPGESTTFDLVWETTESDAGEHDLTVRSESDSTRITVAVEAVPSDPSFDVEITGTNEPVTAGDSLVVTATITNVGSEETTGTVDLVGDDGVTVLDDVDVTLDAGASDSIELTWETTTDDTGVFDLSVVSPSDSDAVTVTVDAPTSDPFFAVSIDDTNEPISAGDALEVTATIANTGDAEGTQTIELVEFDGMTVVDSVSVTLTEGETETITLQWANAPEGTGDVTVQSEDDADSRTVAVGTGTAVDVTACHVIDTAGNYELSSDLSGDDTCITITASDVTFDGGDHVITASDATGNDWGIHVTGGDGRIENVTVKNVVLEGWDNGVRFRNVDDSELSNVVIENGSTGVVLSASHGNTLDNLTIRDNDRRALSLSSSANNAVSGVEATGNEAATTFSGRGSVYLFSSSNNEFEDVAVTDGRSGVRVSFSTGNEFVGLTTERHAIYGLEIGSNSNTFTDIVANDNGWHGIQVNTASFNSFENVSVTGTDGSAVRLTGIGGSGGAPQNNVFENVSVTDNDGAAISLSVANYNTFRDVTTGSNTGTAVTFVSRAGGNLVEGGEIDHGSNTAVNFGPDSIDNTVREVSLQGTGTPLLAQDGGPNNEFDRVDVDGTVISLSARGVGTSQASPSTLPADATPLGSYLGLTPHSSGTTHVDHLRFHYEAADVESLDENALAIWRLSGGEWTAPTDATYVTGVDTDQRYVFANGIDESHLSATFGAFTTTAAPTTDDDTGGSSGGGGGGGGGGSAVPVGPDPEPDVPFFAVSIVETTSPVTAGETLDVTAVVENTGGENGTGPVELLVDGTVVDSTSITVTSGNESAIGLSWATTADDVGDTITVAVRSDDDAATAVVAVNPIDEEADIVLYNARAQSDTVDVGETLTVIGDFYNLGTTGGERTVTLFVAGDPVDDATVTVSPGLARGAAELTWTPTESDVPEGTAATDVTISLDGLLVGTVTVENPYSDIRVIAASASSTELVAGEEAYVVGSIYQAGTITGSETFELVAENVDTGEEVVLGSQEAELAPGYYHLGALNVSYAIQEAGTYDLRLGDRPAGTVEVEAAYSDIQVIAASTSEVDLIAGEEAYVVGSIYQAGTIAGSETFELVAENVDTGEEVVLGSQEAELAPGYYHLGALNVSYTIVEAGTYDLRLGDRSAGTVEIEAAYSDIQVIAASGSEVEIVAGEEAYVIGSIYQAGTIAGSETFELVAENVDTGDELVLGSQERELAPGYYHLGALNVSYTIDEAGTYDLRLGDRPAGTVEVEAAYSDIQVIAAGTSAVDLVAGEEAYAIGSIYQAGTITGSETIELTAENVDTGEEVVLGFQEAELAPGYYHLGALNVSYAIHEAGTYDLRLADRTAGTVTVVESESDVRVIAASIEEIELVQSETAFVIGSIYQAGTDAGPQRIVLEERNLDTNETRIVGEQTVSLQPGFYHLGALNVSYTPETAGSYELTLGDRVVGTVAVDEAITDIRVIGASVSAVELVAGEELFVTGSIYQAGTVAGDRTIELTVENVDTGEVTVVGSQATGELDPGYYHLGALNVSYTPDAAGTYELTLGDLSAGTVEVQAAYSDTQVIAASTSEVDLVAGEEAYVIGSIYQAGTIAGSETIELTAENVDTGEEVVLGAQESPELAPGYYHLGALNVSYAIDEAGTYDLRLADRSAGTVEVVAAYSDVQVIAASTSDVDLVAGEEAYAIGSIYQAGTITGSETIELTAENVDTGEEVVLGAQEAELAPGYYHLGALNVSYAIDEAGTYDLRLGGRNAGTVEVEAAASDIQVIAAGTSAVELFAGEEAFAIGSIYQAGTIAGSETIDLVAENVETGEEIALGSQESPELAPGWYHLGALNVSYAIDEAGTYDLRLGGRNAGTVEVETGTVDVEIVSVEGQGAGFDVETGEHLVYASHSATVDVDVEADVPLDEVTLLVSSQATTFAVTASGTHVANDRWSIDVPLDDIHDDGRYDLTVVAVDAGGTGDAVVAEEVLVVDRSLPAVSVSIGSGSLDAGTITVTSDVPLADVPAVEADFIDADGEIQSTTVTMDDPGPDETRYTGTIHAANSGTYAVTVVATDRAGNEATAEASAHITRRFTLADGPVTFDRHGSAVEFHLAEDADRAIAEQELFGSFTAYDGHHDMGGALGVGFLSADLDPFIDHQLETGGVESATVSIGVDEAVLGDAPIDEVTIHHYEPATGSWTPVETTHGVSDGIGMVSAEVTHFSTYGAFLTDDEPPTVTQVTPGDGPTVTAEDDTVTVAFAYEDDRTGIDVGSVRMAIDGTDVTSADGTTVTSMGAEHVFSTVPGQTHEATLTVADRVGNERTQTTTFDVEPTAVDGGENGSSSEESEAGQLTDSTPEDQSGFGILLALVALLVGAALPTIRRYGSNRSMRL